MNIDKKLTVLKKIAGELNKANVTWATGASLLLYFKSITTEFHDIDIMVTREDAEKAKELLLQMGSLEPPNPNRQYKTELFLEFVIDEVDVDVMAGFKIVQDDKVYDCSLRKDEIVEHYNLDGESIPLQSVDLWCKYYGLMGRAAKVEMIQKAQRQAPQNKLRNMTAIYLFKGEKVLLLYRQGGRVVNNVWTGSAGGHFETHELNDPQACVLREMQEELGLELKDLDGLAMRYITLRNTKGEIRQNYYFFAELKDSVDENLVSTEGTCKWFSLEEIHELEMPFTARYVIEHFCKIGRFTDILYTGVTNSEGVEFTELQEC